MTIEVIFWIVIAVVAFLAFGLWLALMCLENQILKRIEQINRDEDELVKQAQLKRDRVDTKWGEL